MFGMKRRSLNSADDAVIKQIADAVFADAIRQITDQMKGGSNQGSVLVNLKEVARAANITHDAVVLRHAHDQLEHSVSQVKVPIYRNGPHRMLRLWVSPQMRGNLGDVTVSYSR